MKKVLLVIKISLLILCLNISFGCETPSQDYEQDLDILAPDENSHNVEMKRYKGDKLEYLLKAKNITRYYDKQQSIADSVYIVTVEEDTGIVSTVVCDTTIIDDKSNIIKGVGNVVFTYGDLRRIETDLALWDRAKDRITCPDTVDYWDKNTYLKGSNLVTNSKLEMTKIDHVSGEGVADEETFSGFSNSTKRDTLAQ